MKKQATVPSLCLLFVLVLTLGAESFPTKPKTWDRVQRVENFQARAFEKLKRKAQPDLFSLIPGRLVKKEKEINREAKRIVLSQILELSWLPHLKLQ